MVSEASTNPTPHTTNKTNKSKRPKKKYTQQKLTSPAPNLPCGSAFHIKPKQTLRIWGLNVNGIKSFNNYSSLHELCSEVKQYHPDVFALQETNLDFYRNNTHRDIESVFKQHFGKAKLIASNPISVADKDYKPGGTALIIVGKWVSSIISKSYNNLGRFTSVDLNISGQPNITIFSSYNTCKMSKDNAGLNTIYKQQWSALRLKGIKNPDP